MKVARPNWFMASKINLGKVRIIFTSPFHPVQKEKKQKERKKGNTMGATSKCLTEICRGKALILIRSLILMSSSNRDKLSLPVKKP